MDIHSKEIRSNNMSRVRSKGTKPETLVARYLFTRGFRYRKNVSSLFGCPDIVLPKYRTVIFVNGCFWHVHDDCKHFAWPKSNIEFWRTKLLRNIERDLENYESLRRNGWKVLIIWECELKKSNMAGTLSKLEDEIRNAQESL